MTLILNGTTGITSPGGDTSTSLATSGLSIGGVSLGAGNATRFKNRIINGDMRIDQRNAGALVNPAVANSYYLDRWYFNGSPANKLSVGQNAGSVTPPAGFINYLGFTSLSSYSVAAGETFYFSQKIEGLNIADLAWGTANAKTVTLSAWVYSSLTGTFAGALRNSAATRSYPFTFTISSANTWTQISVTIAGDTSGTWLTTNGVGIELNFSLGTGSTYTTTGNAWAAGNYVNATGATSVVGTSGATFYITSVQLEVGSSATGFEYVDYTTQLAMCQRYYYKQSGAGQYGRFGVGVVGSGSSTNFYSTTWFPVSMRAAPTSVDWSSLAVWKGGTVYAASAISLDGAGLMPQGASLVVTSSGLSAETYYMLFGNNSGSAYLAFSAEL